ncbi:MAG: hypothetical protein C5B51_17875 [Terriglobia bacterium]|nr:MAG: hypothetical protein C5B51_17875 [Terriglobia bacterium]
MRMRLWVVFLVAVWAPVASAQRGGNNGPRGQQESADDQYGALTNRPYTQSKLDRLGDMLRLSRDQKNGAREIFDAAQKEAAPLREEIIKGRAAIAVAMISEKPQAEIDQLIATYGNLMAQMTGFELRAFAKLCATLNPDQQKRVGPVFAFMSGMFSSRNWNTTVN